MQNKTFVNGAISVMIGIVLVSILSSNQPLQVLPGEQKMFDGVLIENHGKEATMKLNADDLEQLIYREDEIPCYTVIPTETTGAHTVIDLNAGGEERPVTWLRSSILRFWGEEERAQQYRQGLIPFSQTIGIVIRVDVYDKRAKVYGKTFSEWKKLLAIGHRFREGTPSGLSLGEESWHLPGEGCQLFSLGRCFVHIILAPDPYFAEALAWGIEYRIQQHPKRLGMVQKPLTILVSNQPIAQGKAVSLAGVTVAPISALSPAQVSFKTNRTSKEWTVIASRNGKWVKLKAFSWDMETEKGKVKLERPVFPYKGELIVPLRQVAESLGISVQQKGQTIALLPK